MGRDHLLEFDRKISIFRFKEIWFADRPYDVDSVDGVLFRSCPEDLDIQGFVKEPFKTPILDITQDLDTIWSGMDKSSCRYSVNRAERSEVKVRTDERYDEFLSMLQDLYKKKGLAKAKVGKGDLENKGILFIAEKDGDLLCGQFYRKDEHHIRWLFGASDRLASEKERATLIGHANKLLSWKAINYAKEKGIQEFDFGGYAEDSSPELKGINDFKMSFGCHVVTKFNYQRNYSPLLRMMYGARRLAKGKA